MIDFFKNSQEKIERTLENYSKTNEELEKEILDLVMKQDINPDIKFNKLKELREILAGRENENNRS